MSPKPRVRRAEALAIHRHNDKLTQRIKEVLEKKTTLGCSARFTKSSSRMTVTGIEPVSGAAAAGLTGFA